ncbi:MAG TPA: hypothetical protein VFI42_13775 [Thermomicrobiaceae bacterium]|nr:hypothetical protein [Thermomicrobiaceae bacterium]
MTEQATRGTVTAVIRQLSDATARLRDGQTLLVDGNRGVVELPA